MHSSHSSLALYPIDSTVLSRIYDIIQETDLAATTNPSKYPADCLIDAFFERVVRRIRSG